MSRLAHLSRQIEKSGHTHSLSIKITFKQNIEGAQLVACMLTFAIIEMILAVRMYHKRNQISRADNGGESVQD